jgi:asparaginyl-tRNA synthetase
VRTARRQKRYSFLELTDGTCASGLQVVWPEAGGASAGALPAADAALLTAGASVSVEGVLLASPKPGQAVELAASRLRVVCGADAASYPLQKKAHSVEFLRDVLHLRARGALGGAVLRARHTLSAALHAHLQGAGLLQVHTPVLTGNDCEGAGELFTAVAGAPPPGAPQQALAGGGGFFGRPAYLTVSGQLHLEAFAAALSRVYSFGPTFRAENSNTTRHLAEFWMVEPEVAPAGLPEALRLCEGAVAAAAGALLAQRRDDVELLAAGGGASGGGGGGAPLPLVARLEAAARGGFAVLTYCEALAALGRGGGGRAAPPWGSDLSGEQERWLAEKHVGGPVFVTHYPAVLKPFYMRASGGGGGTVDNFDLLVPGAGELAGGSAREHRHDLLAAAMAKRGLLSDAVVKALAGADGGASRPPADPANGTLDWYLDLRRYGGVPSAGWGLGFERLVAWACGLDNVRDAAPCPRARNLCSM